MYISWMLSYELHKWLMKTSRDPEAAKEITNIQIECIKELLRIRDESGLVALDLLQAAIELSHIGGGARELSAFADHLRNMADSLDVRIKRSNIKTVSVITDPTNQA